MEMTEKDKKAAAYDKIMQTLRKCSSETKKEFLDKFIGSDQDLP